MVELEESDAAFLCSCQALRACCLRPFSYFPLWRRLVPARKEETLVHCAPYGIHSLESDSCKRYSSQDFCTHKCWDTKAPDRRNSSSKNRT